MVNENLVQALENHLSATKEKVDQANLARKLAGNRDFRKLILEGFCRDDAARLVAESADPVLDVQQRADALAMAQAGGHLKRYLSMMIQQGMTAEREIGEIELELEEARAEAGE